MKTVTFTHLRAKCEYNFETKNLHIISKHSFNSPKQYLKTVISKKYNIKKEDIKTITFKHPNTKLPSHISDYFANYPNLEYIELEKLDFKNVETIDGFIYNCPKLKEITIAHKNAENLISIKDLIVKIENTKIITIKNINAPNLQKITNLLRYIECLIEKITIKDITAPNIKTVDYLIYSTPIKTLDLTKIGDVNVHTIKKLIGRCNELETLKIKPLTNTKEIEIFIQKAPVLKTDIISKINRVKKLYPYFLTMTPKTETLDLDKFENIDELTTHLNGNPYDNIEEPQYTKIKLGNHKIKFIDYSTILKQNITIVDKTEKEIVKEIITQSKNETKINIENFLETLENKKMFKNPEYKKQLKSKLTIIKNLK